MKNGDRRQTVAPRSVLFTASGWNLWPVPACLVKPAPHSKGHSSFSGFTFTLTSLLRPTERVLLIQGRFFPSVWLPEILLDAWCCVGAAQQCWWCVLCGSKGWVLAFEQRRPASRCICVLVPMFLIPEPCEWFSRVSCFLLPSRAVEISSKAQHWSFIQGIQILQVCPFSSLVTAFLSFMQSTRCWNQDNERTRAFWNLMKWLFSLQKASFCADSATWLSVLLDPLGSTPAKLIGPVEACRLSGVNTSMPGGNRSSDLNQKPSPDPGYIMTPSTAAQGDEGEIRVLVGDGGDKMSELSSNCIWRKHKLFYLASFVWTSLKAYLYLETSAGL